MKTKKCGPDCIACDCGRTDNKCKFNIWMDGFSINGNRQGPQLIIEDVIGEGFESACFVALSGSGGDASLTLNAGQRWFLGERPQRTATSAATGRAYLSIWEGSPCRLPARTNKAFPRRAPMKLRHMGCSQFSRHARIPAARGN